MPTDPAAPPEGERPTARPIGRCINCFHDFKTGPCGGCGAVDYAPEDPLRTALGAVAIECEHGYDVCPQCDGSTTPAAQPDEAAGLVEKCARALCDITEDDYGQRYCQTHGPSIHVAGVYSCESGASEARAVLSVLGPAIREQHGEQIARWLVNLLDPCESGSDVKVKAIAIARGQGR